MKKLYFILFVTGMFFGSNSNAQTTYNDVAKIFYSHCTGCHHPGGIAPKSLMDYTNCNANSAGIKADLNSGKMPPWLPDTTYGNVRFIHEQIITLADKNLILKWISDGSKQGDPSIAPSAPYYDDYAYKLCPTPTMVLKMKPRKIAHDEGTDCYPVDTKLPKARYLRAYEIVPGNSAIVNFVLVGLAATSNIPGAPTLPTIPGVPLPAIPPVQGVGLTNDTTGACYFPAVSSYVGAYSPNAAPTVWPGKAPLRAGMLIPANAQLNLQIHYTAGALGQYDSTQIRLYFYPDTATNVRNITTTSDINNLTLVLFPNQVTTVIDSIAIDSNRSVLGIFPNAHGICTKMNVDGISQTPNIPLLNIKSWNKKFASFYTYRKLVKFPSTYKLRASNTYDNTTANPNNPNKPPKLVTYSPSDTGEVQFDAIQWLRYKTGDENIDIQALLKCDTLLVCKPGAAGLITGSSTVCTGQTAVSFSVPGIVNAATYTWSYSGTGATIHGNGTTVTIDFSATATAGNLKVAGVNECGVSGKVSANKAIALNSGTPVAAAGTITGTASVCKGQTSISYTVPTISGATAYAWVYSGTGATIKGTGNSITIDFSATATSGNLTVMGISPCLNGIVSASYAIAVNSIPTTPTIAVVNNCGSSELTCSATVGSFLWSPGGATTQVITATTDGTYSVTVSLGGSCSSTSIGSVVTIKTSPSITSPLGATRCGAGTVSLGATAAVGTINWYAAATGGTSLATGANYTTPNLTSTTTYYVDATNNGCSSTPRTAVVATINNGPTATISGTTKVCKGSTGMVSIALTGTAPWAFTYGTTSGASSVTNIAVSNYTVSASVGTYTVASISDASGCAGSTSGSATLSENSPIVLTTPTVTCNGNNSAYVVDFDMSGGDAGTYVITGGTGNKSGNHYTSASISTGTSTTFSVTDTYRCSPVATVNATPNCGCLATGTISGGGAVCNGGSASISIALTGASPWKFTYAINGVNQPEVTGQVNSTYTFTTSTSGAYTLVSITDANCKGSTSGTATVSQAQPTATISGGGAVCAGNTVNLSFDLTSGTAPWSFTYSDGTTTSAVITSNLANQLVPVSLAGTYTIVSVTTGACNGTGSGSATVIVNALPAVGAAAAPSSSICAGSSVTLSGTGAIAYTWSDGVKNRQAFAITASKTFTVTGTDANNCSNKATQSIVVIPGPTVTQTASPSSAAVCEGGKVTLTGGGAVSYVWSGGVKDGVAFTPPATQTYTVTGKDENNCTGTTTRVVTVFPLPNVSIVVSPVSSSVCLGDSIQLSGAGAKTYTWDGGVVDGAKFAPTASGVFSVTGRDAYSCTNTASQVVVVNECNVQPIGIKEEVSSLQQITVYPNPNNGTFSISVKNAKFKELTIVVVNMLGSEVFTASDKNNSTEYRAEVNLETLPKGVYYLKLSTGNDTVIKKLIIQ
jgi:Ig-like domain CHU_C associated/Secretion system C-terminal sorting domain/PKD-like domain